MKKRFLSTSAAIVLAIGACGLTSAPAASAPAVDRDQVTKDFVEALSVVEQHYAGSVDYDRVGKGAIYGMLHTLDPHSNYYDRDEFEAFQTEQQSQYFGIGANIGPRNGNVYILAPFPGTPAFRAGLRYGDQIVEIDGKSTTGWSSLQVSTAMKGPRGTKVVVKVARPGVAEPITNEIIRDAVPLPTITNAYMLSPTVGYIHLQRGFNFTSSREVREALQQLKNDGMKSLVFDLRGNGGGLVREAVAIASDFLYKGQSILSIRGRSNAMRGGDIPANNPNPDDFPLVVLVDGATASASEIVAGSLQDHDRALIVGQVTFGKGLVQNPFELDKNGGGLILTTGKYYTPSGRLIQRDYSHLSFYDYYYARRNGQTPVANDKKQIFHTDSGRPIYGGGGITPDVEVEITAESVRKPIRWFGAMFAFTREVVNGQVAGFESWKVDQLVPDHNLQTTDFVITDRYVELFKKFVTTHPEFKLSAADVEADRELLKNELRRELATAHYGIEAAAQVTALVDPQMIKAQQEMPQAERMAQAFRKNRPLPGGSLETAVKRN